MQLCVNANEADEALILPWFLDEIARAAFNAFDSEINVAHPGGGGHKAEFVNWRWEQMKNLPTLIIPFKRPVYERVVKEFASLAEE